MKSSKFLLGGLLKTIKGKIEQYFPGTRAFFTYITADLDQSMSLSRLQFIFNWDWCLKSCCFFFIQHFWDVFSELEREITSMHIVQNFGLIIWCCFLLIMLSFAADNENADVIKHCMNSTNSTSCSLTYEHVYKSLTKNENSFNISHALYPEGGKPSFLVRVNVYGPNKTHNSTPAQFIWSIHCLFSSVPALLLEMLSLGSIIVTSRTQELDVQIPAFCCNLSENIEKRKEMIQGFLTRALFEVSAHFVWILK